MLLICLFPPRCLHVMNGRVLLIVYHFISVYLRTVARLVFTFVFLFLSVFSVHVMYAARRNVGIYITIIGDFALWL